jgi:prophage regulatory protein
MTDTLLRLPEVMRRVGLKKSSIYARVHAGTFPKPTREGGVSRWFESEIDDYIAGLKARRDGDQNGDQQQAA